MSRRRSTEASRPSASVDTINFPLDVNLVNIADKHRLEPGDRVIEVRSAEIPAGVMIATRVADGALIIHIYDAAGPVIIRVGREEVLRHD